MYHLPDTSVYRTLSSPEDISKRLVSIHIRKHSNVQTKFISEISRIYLESMLHDSWFSCSFYPTNTDCSDFMDIIL